MNKKLLWQPYLPEYIRDPYTMYKSLRENEPVHLSQTKEYIISRYDDVKEILKSSSFQTGNRLEWLKRGIHYFENKDQDLNSIYEAINSFILLLNAPQHAKIRNFVIKAWDNREIDLLIKKNVHEVLSNLNNTEIDVVTEYSQRVTILTISDILGIPTEDYQYLRNLSFGMTKSLDLYVSFGDLVKVSDSSKKFIDYFREQIRIKKNKRDEGLLSKMIWKNETENHGLTESELISLAIFLFVAGQETSSSLISTGIYQLLQHPDQLLKLREQPDLIKSTVDEILRYDSTVQLLGRISKEDYTLRDTTIPAGSTVTLAIGSANRDENVFHEAEKFIITRQPNRHLSFGTGVHFCLGDWLGRKQGEMAIQSFFENYPKLFMPDQKVTWFNNLAIRGISTLRVGIN